MCTPNSWVDHQVRIGNAYLLRESEDTRETEDEKVHPARREHRRYRMSIIGKLSLRIG